MTVFTIGHSTHPIATFTALLRQHAISAAGDVRSMPFSRRNPQFNRHNLEAALRAENIAYIFLGKELGARSEDPACYQNGKVQYELMAQTPLFAAGITHLTDLIAQGQRLAILCAEKEPLMCHRTILVARHLQERGIHVMHIHGDGLLEPHAEAIHRLASQLKLPPENMFRTSEDIVAEAYRIQGERIAYTRAEAQDVIIGP